MAFGLGGSEMAPPFMETNSSIVGDPRFLVLSDEK